jgi:hypothetical protein
LAGENEREGDDTPSRIILFLLDGLNLGRVTLHRLHDGRLNGGSRFGDGGRGG